MFNSTCVAMGRENNTQKCLPYLAANTQSACRAATKDHRIFSKQLLEPVRRSRHQQRVVIVHEKNGVSVL